LRPDAGTAMVLGQNLWSAARELRQKVAYVAQTQQLPGWMTLEDIGRCQGSWYEGWDDALAQKLAKRWDLSWKGQLAELSVGQQRQATLLLALAVRPQVLLLDEPAAGLDPVARRSLLQGIVEALCQEVGCTVLISTHLISDLERVADQIGIMDRGRLVMSARLETLLQTTKRVQVVFDESGPPADFAIPGARRCRTQGPVMTAVVEWTTDDQLNWVREWPGVRVNLFPMDLEEIFLEWFERTDSETALTN
jgi:ABC-2 type transport system ATP-binding protein